MSMSVSLSLSLSVSLSLSLSVSVCLYLSKTSCHLFRLTSRLSLRGETLNYVTVAKDDF